jgi:Fe-S-cluster-containing hydrogenase component 2
MNAQVLLSDPAKCTGCGLCRIACSLRKAGVCSPQKSRVRVYELDAADRYLPIACQHCEAAPCAAACPREAISRDDALVRTVIDYNLCVGCRMCVFACPFGAMGFDEDCGKPFKCDLCDGDPLCVTFCMPGALRFVSSPMIQYPRLREAALRASGVRR